MPAKRISAAPLPSSRGLGGAVAVLLACCILVVGSARCAEPASRKPADDHGVNAPAPPPDRQEVIRYAATSGEGTWKKVAGPAPNLSSRELFTCGLAWSEAGMYRERLETLFETAAKMQDRDPKSRGYGNFRWQWSQDKVLDYNAVEFCMQGGALLWMRHRDAMPEGARKRLREILDYAVEGCLRHKVRPGYTNIALMNAENLILLGETLDMPRAADEGYARLGQIVMNTWECGITEYGSPTYYGVDLDCLGLMEAFIRRESGQAQVRALLDLFWTDIALNGFPFSQRLGGPHSRDYDYVRGHGGLETHLWMAGWIGGDMRGGIGAVFPALARWQPPARLYEMSRAQFPRLVRQMWGTAPNQSRTHYLLRDVTLGTAGANYHNMDLPLTVDLPGDADLPRCYFIPDARHDPYGKVKIPESSGGHEKTLHLRPFWAATERRTDALGLALYRDEDMTKTATTLESHFVMPREVDGFWIGDERISIRPDTPATFPLKAGQPLILRKGTAAVGVRVPWALAVGGKPAPAAFVYDGNKYGVVRLTATHYESKDPAPSVVGAGAALWVRVGGGLETDEAFHAWRRQFADARADAMLTSGKLRISAAGADGPLTIDAAYPDGASTRTDPAPARTILELNGEDIGRRFLENVEPVKSRLSGVGGARGG